MCPHQTNVYNELYVNSDMTGHILRRVDHYDIIHDSKEIKLMMMTPGYWPSINMYKQTTGELARKWLFEHACPAKTDQTVQRRRLI